MGLLFTKCLSKEAVEDVTVVINAIDDTIDVIDQVIDEFKKKLDENEANDDE